MIYFKLDKNSEKAMYLQIADQLKEKIISNELHYDQKLLSESDFSRLYNVSEIVIKNAYNILREEGLIRSIRGKGTFVSNRPVVILNVENLGKLPGPKNVERFETIILIHDINSNQEEAKRYLEVSKNEKTYLVKLIITINKRPILYQEIIYINELHEIMKSYFMQEKSLSDFIKENYNKDSYKTAIYHTINVDEFIANILKIDKGDPGTVFKFIFKSNNKKIIYMNTVSAGDYLYSRASR